MTSRDKGARRALIISAAIHLGLIALLLTDIPWPEAEVQESGREVIQARALDHDPVAERRRAEQARRAREKAEAEAEAEARRRAREERQAEEEARRRAEEAARREAEREAQRRAEEEARRKAQRQAEEEARRKAEEQRRAEEAAQRRAEEQRRAEQEARQKAEERRRAEEEARREAEREAEAERRAEEQRRAEERRRAEEARRQQELEAEQQRLEQQRQARLDRQRNRYVARIEAKVTRSWRPPEGSGPLSAVARVRLSREGRVLSVRVLESSGNPGFDSSLERAVLRASPLPVPDDDELFESSFREFNMKFSPRDM